MAEEATYLIAVPQLGDPQFTHKVVLMLHHDEEGALGLVINDPIDLDLGSFAEANKWPCNERISHVPVFRGGPVTPEQGWILHSNATVAEKKELVPGLYLSGHGETLRTLFAEGDPSMRLMLGYAGWGAGQLETELMEGSWITSSASLEHTLLTKPDQTWKAVLHNMGIEPSALTLGSSIPS